MARKNRNHKTDSLKNHYLITHPATRLVFGIGLVLLLIMLASIPKETARKVEQTPIIKFQDINFYSCDDDGEPITLNQLFTPSNYQYGTHGIK